MGTANTATKWTEKEAPAENPYLMRLAESDKAEVLKLTRSINASSSSQHWFYVVYYRNKDSTPFISRYNSLEEATEAFQKKMGEK